MSDKKILSIGAHPDDADTYSGGLLMKLMEAGWGVRLLSITDGGAGTYREWDRTTVAATRKEEARKSGELLGGQYDVWDYPDGRLQVTLEARERLIGYIRDYSPDVIITNRPNDYHADHRNVSLLVQDASFLLTVPHIVAEHKYMETAPAILFWSDDFRRPYPHQSDICVPLKEEREEFRVKLASCHESQYFDWLYWPNHREKIDWPRERQISDLTERFKNSSSAFAEANRKRLIDKFGEDGKKVRFLETYEISEYGEAPTEEFLKIAESME